jgi:hypothetical protein
MRVFDMFYRVDVDRKREIFFFFFFFFFFFLVCSDPQCRQRVGGANQQAGERKDAVSLMDLDWKRTFVQDFFFFFFFFFLLLFVTKHVFFGWKYWSTFLTV